VALAERVQGSAVRFEHMADQLAEADIVISSTGSQGIVIDQEMVRQAHRARKGRPMFFIDIAVPRDIDPAVEELSDVYCYDIDNLQAAADANHRERETEALRAQRIVEEEVERYERWKHSESVVPVLKALRAHFTRTGEGELNRTLERLAHLSEQDAAAVRRLVQSTINKLLHVPSTRLKEMGEERNGRLYAEALAALFGLSSEEGGPAAAPPAAESDDLGRHGEGRQSEGRQSEGEQADNVLRLHRTGPSPS
jgi:glutamyl-tRNA reductase